MMRIIKIVLWILVVVTTGATAYLYIVEDKVTQGSSQVSGDRMGGEFSLVRQDGKPVTDKDLLGKPHAMFFGFTNCPEVCPTTLYEISTWLSELGKDADGIDVYFMTVDPERDTVEVLADYLTSFDARIIGITGKKPDVEQTLRSYRVYFKRVELENGDYNMDHTAIIYLLDAEGKFAGSISYGEDGKSAIAKLRKLMKP
ncbi:MAG: SCO family protein [Hyphomicrobiales bacterium]|nr:SCO family protein [Hyphomicrobiales bacterium]